MVYIIILNWNGWIDTIECIESIIKSNYPNYCIVVVDNGSSDNSCEKILSWTSKEIKIPIKVFFYDRVIAEGGGDKETEKKLKLLPASQKIVLIKNNENLGFAGGSNVGIRYALSVGAQYIWLLNNDTTVEPTALQNMVSFMETHLDFQGVTGQIRLYDNPSLIWNCGGSLTCYGARRYHFGGYSVDKAPKQGFQRISFITGCAPLFRGSLFEEAGILSERFFFGEEDFEFSQRLKKNKYKIACQYNAIIYHKVGSSTKGGGYSKNFAKTYIYYLNRFINMRNHWPTFIWKIWRFFYIFYVLFLLRKGLSSPWKDLWLFRKSLFKDSMQMDGVSRSDFEYIFKHKFDKLP